MRPALLLLALLAAPRPAAGAPTAWSRQVPPVAPVARAFSAAVSTPSSLNVFGGLAGDALSGVPGDLAVDPLSGLPASQGAPTGARLRTSQAATCEVDTDAVPDLMGGGVAAISLLGLLEDGSEAPATTVYKYLPAAGGWAAQAITGTSFPAPRRGATAVFLRECRLGRNCVIVYGGVGRTAPNTAADACWLYFPGTSAATGGNWQICTQSGPAPPSAGGLVGHVAVASPDGLSMFVFGGTYLGTNTVSNDIFQFKVNGYLDAQSSTSEMQALLTGTGTTAVTTAGSSSLFTNNRTGATAAETRVVIDGSTSQTYVPATGAGCFVTYSDASGVGTTNPWWRADMGYPSYASFSDNNMFLVLAWMRTDAATGRNTGVSFWFSNVTDPKPWEAGGGGVQWPNPYTDPIYNPLTLWASGWPNAPVPVNARYVWAANLGTNRVLQLCELQVWQPFYWRWRQLSGVVNLSLNKRALSTGVVPDPAFNYGDPQNMVDGATGTILRTGSPISNVWAYVDLGATYDVSYVTAIDGASSNPWRNMGTEVWMGDSADALSPTNFNCAPPQQLSCYYYGDPVYGTPEAGLSNPRCTAGSAAFGSITWRECAGPARYVILRKHDVNTNINITAYPLIMYCKFFAAGASCPASCTAAAITCGGAGSGDGKMLVIAELQVWGNKLRYMPTARTGAAAGVYGEYMVVFGGTDPNGFPLADTRLFNMVTGAWEAEAKPLGTPPAGRTGATLTALYAGAAAGFLTTGSAPPPGRLALVGGVGAGSTLNDVSVLSFPQCPALAGSEPGLFSVTCKRYGSVCTYSCWAGFSSNGGQAATRPATQYYSPISGQIACRADGTWGAAFPLCVPDGTGAGYLPSPPTILTFPPVAVAGGAGTPAGGGPGAFGVGLTLQRAGAPGFGNPTGPTSYRLRSMPKFWAQRFFGAPLDAAWTLRNGPPFSSLTGTYTMTLDGLLAIDAPPNADCKFDQQDCTVLTRAFPTGPSLPSVATDAWSIEARVSFDFYTVRAPLIDNMVGIGLFDTAVPVTVPDPRNTSLPLSYTGAMHFMADIKRFCSTPPTGGCQGQGGWESQNLATGFMFSYTTSPNTLIGVVGSPWAFVRVDRYPDESVLPGLTGAPRPGYGAWRVCLRYDTTMPWACGPWLDDATMLRPDATGARKFNPATAQIALFARSSTTARAYGRFDYIRFGPLDDDPPGPVVVLPAYTNASVTATQAVVTPAGFARGSALRFTIESGGSLGYGAPSSASGLVAFPVGGAGWNVSALIEVAAGKRTGQVSTCSGTGCPTGYTATNTGSGQGVDGVIDGGGFVFTNANADGAWWFVDLGIPSAVKEVALYNVLPSIPAPARASNMDNFAVLLAPLQSRTNAAACDPVQVPLSISSPNATVGGFAYAARFNCSSPTGAVGRYLYITNGAGLPLNFREVQVFASNRCAAARNATRATQVPGTTCSAGAAYGAVCVHTCNPGFVPISGSSSSTCNGDAWNDPPLVCAAACPLLGPPSYATDCSRVIYDETFADAAAQPARWLSLTESAPALGPYVFAVNGGLQINAGVLSVGGVMAVSTNSKVAAWAQGFTATAVLATSDAAGLVWYAADALNYYRVYLNVASGSHTVERMYQGALTVLTASMALLVPADTSVELKLVVTPGGRATIYVNGRLLFTVTDSYITAGGVGLAASSFATFDSFTFAVDCTDCAGATDGDRCTFSCAPGLRAVGVTDADSPYAGTRACVAATDGATAAWAPPPLALGGADMRCTLDPPYFPATVLFIAENSPRGALVDAPLVATITSPDERVLFSIKSSNASGIFTIDSCSGQVKVRLPVLDFETVPVYALNVTASVDGFPDAVTTTLIIVALINVDEAPAALPLALALPENAPNGTLVGRVVAPDPEGDAVLYTLDTDAAAGRFVVTPDGRVLVAPGLPVNTLDFEAIGTWPYSIIVRATELTAMGAPCTGAACLTSTVPVTIRLLDRNDPPVLQPGLALVTTEAALAAGAGAVGAALAATDQDNAAGGNFSSPLTFALVSPDAALSVPACAAALASPPFRNPTVSGTQTSAALFSVANASGALAVVAAPAPAITDSANFPPFGYNGVAMRTLYVLCVNVSDGFGGFTVAPATLAVRADVSGLPVATGASGPAAGFPTRGGVLTVTGTGFVSPATVARGALVSAATGRRVNMTCTVTSATAVSCAVPPGSGAGYSLLLDFLFSGSTTYTVAVQPLALTVSYAAPTITSVATVPSGGSLTALSTAAATTLNIVGTNLSPCAPADGVAVSFGLAGTQRPWTALTCAVLPAISGHTNITCSLPPFHSAGWAWYVTVGGVTVDAPAALSLSYAAPLITAVTPAAGACPGASCVAGTFNLSALGTAGGQVVKVAGSGFGPSDAAVTIAGSYGGIAFTSCAHEATGVGGGPSTAAYCVVAPGVGRGLAISLAVGNQATARFAPTPLSYAPPVVLSVLLPQLLATDGGDPFTITGNNFGPPRTLLATAPGGAEAVAYGPPGTPALYAVPVTSCTVLAVLSPQQMTCISVPGVGRALSVIVTVGGQASAPLVGSALSYSPPSVYGFAGLPPAGGSTQGGDVVTITGKNFGPGDAYTNSLLAVAYGVRLAAPAGTANASTVRFFPSACAIDAAGHSVMRCTTAPGAGRALVWTVTVAGQASVQPTTAYAPPSFTAVAVRPCPSGCANAPFADVRGGMFIVVTGANFGPLAYNNTPAAGGEPGGAVGNLLSAVTYGPTGFEYAPALTAASVSLVSPTQLVILCLPGAGKGNRIRLTVGDQTAVSGDAPGTTFDFGTPTVVSLSPATADTRSDPRSPTVVTLVVQNLPLADARSRVGLLFGNVALTPVLPVGPLAIAAATNASDPWGAVAISFVLPADFSGALIPVVVTVTSAVTGVEVDRSLPLPAALFSYNPPRVDSVVVTRARFAAPAAGNATAGGGAANADAIPCPFPPASGFDCADTTLVQLSVFGAAFGACSPSGGACPPGAATADGVAKSLELLYTNYTGSSNPDLQPYGETWCGVSCVQSNNARAWFAGDLIALNSVKLVWVQAWSHTRIIAYARTTAATARVRLVSTLAAGGPVEQTVVRAFTQASPEVGSLTGAVSGVPTTGGTTPVAIAVSSLATDNSVTVTVGGVAATLVLAGCAGLAPAATVTALINAQLAVLPQGSPVTICILVPPGQGAAAPVIVTRIDAGGGLQASNSGLSVSYAPPTLSAVEVWDPAPGGGYARTGAPVVPGSGATVLVATDGSSRVRVVGANLGAAPLVYMGDVAAAGAAGAGNATACAGTAGQHTCYELAAVPGEGTGAQWSEYAAVGTAYGGYSIFLEAGGQDSVGLRFAYRAPAVAAVAPAGAGGAAALSTEGGVLVLITGSNFGVRVGLRPDSFIAVALVAPPGGAGAPLACDNVTRVSHTALTCTLPEGSGAGLGVAVTVADVTGTTPAAVSYAPPTLAAAWAVPLSALAARAGGAAGVPALFTSGLLSASANGTFSFAALGGVAAAPGGAPLAGAAAGLDTVLVLDGLNFGALLPGVHCAFLTWSFRPVDGPGRTHACDGYEGFLGEGEVAAGGVLFWSHRRVAFVVPPGLGTKDVELSVRGAMLKDGVSRADARTPRFRYAPPVITGGALADGSAACDATAPAPCQLFLVGTTGGEGVVLRGANFGPPPRNTTALSSRLPGDAGWPAPGVPLAAAPALPTAALVVTFHRACLVLATAVTGLPLTTSFRPWYARPGEAVSLASCGALAAVTDAAVFFAAPAGIGANRRVQVFVVEDAAGFPAALPLVGGGAVGGAVALGVPPGTAAAATSNAARELFSYRPPSVASYRPYPVYLAPTLGADGAYVPASVEIHGADFGDDSVAAAQGWLPEERLVRVLVGGLTSPSAVRSNVNGEILLSATFPPDAAPAGYRNVTLYLAGQVGVGSEAPAFRYSPLLLVCAPGFFGRVNETCLPCPAQYPETPALTGASCAGYAAPAAADAGVTSGPAFNARFTYPRPLKGWYNLNSTDANVVANGSPGDSQMSACPAGFQVAGRDVCIVRCDPPEACLGDNVCAYGYASKPPMWQCGVCDKSFYQRAGQCIKCPDSPAALFIGFILLVVAAAVAGYYLNKKGVNIAVVSIGVDFFQVLAIFSQSRVKWPPVVKELFHVLSAFNLNIEIVAPECLIPDVSFAQKFFFIMLLPLCFLFLFGLVFVWLALYKACVLGRAKSELFGHRASMISSCLVLLYLLYLYLTRTILDVFNCGPKTPDDGKTYLQAVLEECGKPGGTQAFLVPFGVAGLAVYTAGYPAFILWTLYQNRELAMEDQLLRAKGVGNDALTNPHALMLRQTYGRSYLQFKPDWVLWIGAILLRKLCISLCAVVFSRNTSFQMAGCLLVMFLAYAAQVQLRPYMSPGDYDEVLKSHVESSYTNARHARLRTVVSSIETRGRKKAHKNLLNAAGEVDRSAVLGVLTGFFFNYNTIEAIMQFAAVIVCLMGIMYEALAVQALALGTSSQDSVTAVVLITIIAAIVYFATVVFTEIYVLATEDSARKRLERAAARKKGRDKSAAGGADDDKADALGGRARGGAAGGAPGDGFNVGTVDSTANPMFLAGAGAADARGGAGRGAGGAAGAAGGALDTTTVTAAIMSMSEPPPLELWRVFQSTFRVLSERAGSLADELLEARKAAAGGGAGDDDDGVGGGAHARRVGKKSFGQVQVAAAEGGAGDRLDALRAFRRGE